jgi:signal transduction histidine kinase
MNHVFVELLKNAMESSVKQSLKLNKDGILPPAPIHIHILDQGDDHVFICIVDQGMGISKEAAKFAFRFAESTSLKRWDRIDEQQSYAMV